MKTRYAYVLVTLSVIFLFLSGFTSENDFPAPVKEPAAAIYINLSSSGIFDEENNSACEEIAKSVANICKLRNAEVSENEYKNITLSFLKESIISGFLKIHEIYFYFKTPEEYALIAKGEFDLFTIAEKSKAEMIFDKDEKLKKITTSISSDNEKEKMLLQANNNTLVICPEKALTEISDNLESNKNLLGEKFKTFGQMLKHNPAISAEIDIQNLFKEMGIENLPKSVTATDIIRLFVAAKQNKIQISVPEDEEREELKKELEKQTIVLNNIFDNKTDYKLREGKSSLFIETKTDEEQVQSISQKATAFMLHFFVKNISSDQQ